MSFAIETREEISRTETEREECAAYELSAALLASGGISFKGFSHYSISFISTEASTARRYFGMLKQFWSIQSEIRTVYTETLKNQRRYQLIIPDEEAEHLLEKLGLLDPEALFGIRSTPAEIPPEKYDLCRSVLRGAFLSCGAMSAPEKEYTLELASPKEEMAEYIIRILDRFDIPAKLTTRKNKYLVYLKRSDAITDLLRLLGANRAVMQIENIRIQKEIGSNINRRMNCDASNIERMLNASMSQIEDIKLIEEEVGLSILPKGLRSMAELRVEHPESSLAELGELMTPPIGKSGVNLRLRKLSEYARRIRTGEDLVSALKGKKEPN